MRNVRHTIGFAVAIVGGLALIGGVSSAYNKYGPQLSHDRTQYITVIHDQQENLDVNAWHNGCTPAGCALVTQTAADVARSNRTGGTYGWLPSPDDFYLTHPKVTTVAPEQHHRRIRVTKVIREYIEK